MSERGKDGDEILNELKNRSASVDYPALISIHAIISLPDAGSIECQISSRTVDALSQNSDKQYWDSPNTIECSRTNLEYLLARLAR